MDANNVCIPPPVLGLVQICATYLPFDIPISAAARIEDLVDSIAATLPFIRALVKDAEQKESHPFSFNGT